MTAAMLRASYTISAPTLQRFNALVPAGERSRVMEHYMQQALADREKELQQIAAAFMADPANTEALADEAAWDVVANDGLKGL